MTDVQKTKKVIAIIGAGPAGIVAAYELQKNKDMQDKYEVHVFEETSEIGGISKTADVSGNHMDMGGHRFFSKNEKVMNWWFNIMPLQGSVPCDDRDLGRTSETKAGGPDPELCDTVMLSRTRVSRIYFKHKFFDYPVKMNLNTIKNMGFIDTMRCGFGYLGSCIHKLPEDNLENFYINRFGRPLYSMFFEGYTEKLWGRHPSEIQADWGAQRVKGLSIQAMLKDIFGKAFNIKNRKVETSLIESFYYPKFGPGQLWTKALKDAESHGVQVEFGHKVVGIDNSNNKIHSIIVKDTETGEETDFKCDYVLSSMPIKDLAESVSNIPDNIKSDAVGLPYRDFITCGLLVDKLAVKNRTNIKTYNDLVPDCWIYVQDNGVTMGRVQIFNNWSPYMVKDYKNKVWIGTEYFCNEGDSLWNMTDEQFTKLAVSELQKIGLLDKNIDIKLSHVEHVKKAYPAYFDTYDHIKDIQDWVDKQDGLMCIGRNGQHHYNNMDHSMLTAFTAVDILNGLEGVEKKDLWEVNAEKEYHEEKAQA